MRSIICCSNITLYHFISCWRPVLGQPGKGVNRLYREPTSVRFVYSARPSRDVFFLLHNPRYRWTTGAFVMHPFLYRSVTASESTYVLDMTEEWHVCPFLIIATSSARVACEKRSFGDVPYADVIDQISRLVE